MRKYFGSKAHFGNFSEIIRACNRDVLTSHYYLKALKHLGLIKGQIDGPRSKYCIDWKVLDKYLRHFEDWSAKMVKLRSENRC